MADRVLHAIGQGAADFPLYLGLLFLGVIGVIAVARWLGVEWFRVELFRLIKIEGRFREAAGNAHTDASTAAKQVGEGKSKRKSRRGSRDRRGSPSQEPAVGRGPHERRGTDDRSTRSAPKGR
jgi:hypothetical protein